MTSNLFVGSFAFCLHSFGVNWSLMYINNHLPRWTFRFNHDWENGLEFISEVTRSSCFTGYFLSPQYFHLSWKLRQYHVEDWINLAWCLDSHMETLSIELQMFWDSFFTWIVNCLKLWIKLILLTEILVFSCQCRRRKTNLKSLRNFSSINICRFGTTSKFVSLIYKYEIPYSVIVLKITDPWSLCIYSKPESQIWW